MKKTGFNCQRFDFFESHESKVNQRQKGRQVGHITASCGKIRHSTQGTTTTISGKMILNFNCPCSSRSGSKVAVAVTVLLAVAVVRKMLRLPFEVHKVMCLL